MNVLFESQPKEILMHEVITALLEKGVEVTLGYNHETEMPTFTVCGLPGYSYARMEMCGTYLNVTRTALGTTEERVLDASAMAEFFLEGMRLQYAKESWTPSAEWKAFLDKHAPVTEGF
jgi:hypothetical protein